MTKHGSWSQRGYNACSPRMASSQTTWTSVSFERSSHFTRKSCCVRGTWLALVLEGTSPSFCALPSASDFGDTPSGDLFLPQQWFWPLSSHIFYPEWPKEPICKWEHPFRLGYVLNSRPFFGSQGWHLSLGAKDGAFQTSGVCRWKGFSIHPSKKKKKKYFLPKCSPKAKLPAGFKDSFTPLIKSLSP